MEPLVRVGVGVLIYRDHKILLGERLNAHGAGTWAPPGGHIEFGETPEDCALREVKEETGLVITNIKRGPWVSNVFDDMQKHYITLFMLADDEGGEAQLLEPNKCREWGWFTLDQLPQPLFPPLSGLLNMHH